VSINNPFNGATAMSSDKRPIGQGENDRTFLKSDITKLKKQIKRGIVSREEAIETLTNWILGEGITPIAEARKEATEAIDTDY
jgi:hypothetical protein